MYERFVASCLCGMIGLITGYSLAPYVQGGDNVRIELLWSITGAAIGITGVVAVWRILDLTDLRRWRKRRTRTARADRPVRASET